MTKYTEAEIKKYVASLSARLNEITDEKVRQAVILESFFHVTSAFVGEGKNALSSIGEDFLRLAREST